MRAPGLRQVVQTEVHAGHSHGDAHEGKEAAVLSRVREEVLSQEVARPAHQGEAHGSHQALSVFAVSQGARHIILY